MDELTLLQSFGADVRSDEAARTEARRALIAHIERHSAPLWQRRRIVVAAAVLAALALAAAAFGGRLIDLFEGKSASPAVKRELKLEIAGLGRFAYPRRAGWPRPGGYRVAQTRGIMAVRTPHGRVFLWGLLTKSGNVCTILQGATRGKPYLQTGLCVGKRTKQPPILWALASVPFGDPSEPTTADVPILYGHLTPSVHSVELRFEHGRTKQLRVVEGFFAVSVPRAQENDILVGRNAAGHEVDRERVPLTAEPGSPLIPVYGHARILVEINLRAGEPLALYLEPCPHGEAVLNWSTGGGGTTGGCPPRGFGPFPRSTRISLGFGGAGGAYFVHGDAGTRTATVEVIYRDGTKVVVPTAGGWMLYELRPGRTPNDLKELVAFDRDGHKIDRQVLSKRPFP